MLINIDKVKKAILIDTRYISKDYIIE